MTFENGRNRCTVRILVTDDDEAVPASAEHGVAMICANAGCGERVVPPRRRYHSDACASRDRQRRYRAVDVTIDLDLSPRRYAVIDGREYSIAILEGKEHVVIDDDDPRGVVRRDVFELFQTQSRRRRRHGGANDSGGGAKEDDERHWRPWYQAPGHDT
jgi:hypothetical protein